MKTYHDGLAVPSQRILQELGEHRVPVRYLHLHRNKLRIDHVPICELVENSVCTYIHRNYICFELQYLHTALVITVDAYSPCTYVKIILVWFPYNAYIQTIPFSYWLGRWYRYELYILSCLSPKFITKEKKLSVVAWYRKGRLCTV